MSSSLPTSTHVLPMQQPQLTQPTLVLPLLAAEARMNNTGVDLNREAAKAICLAVESMVQKGTDSNGHAITNGVTPKDVARALFRTFMQLVALPTDESLDTYENNKAEYVDQCLHRFRTYMQDLRALGILEGGRLGRCMRRGTQPAFVFNGVVRGVDLNTVAVPDFVAAWKDFASKLSAARASDKRKRVRGEYARYRAGAGPSAPSAADLASSVNAVLRDLAAQPTEAGSLEAQKLRELEMPAESIADDLSGR